MTDYDEDYTPPWRKGTVTMEGGSLPVLNRHLSQLKPRTEERPKVLEETIEAKKKASKARPSGHSLIR